jgi:photosystem II stability/assembly factor-like uncharacterized protein
MTNRLRWFTAAASVLMASGASAAFQIDEIYSNRNSGTNASLQGVIATDTQIVVVGTGGRILRSTNGTNWVAAQSKTAINLAGVAWSGAHFVAMGASGVIDTSPDGLTWSVVL